MSPAPISQHLSPTSTGHVNGATALSVDAIADPAPKPRKLVPFEAESHLWPYPRAPLDDRADDDTDVVELDFNDTRALSDPTLFSKSLKEKQSKGGNKQGKTGEKPNRTGEPESKADRKKRIAEKAVVRQRQREEILNSWDDPVVGQARTSAPAKLPPSIPAINGNCKVNAVNGTIQATPRMNGGETRNGIPVVAAKETVVSLTSMHRKIPGGLSRNDFVRDLLTLIHTDKTFVDGLYQDYLSRTA